MTYTNDDLKKMKDDCVEQVKAQGYDVHTIVGIEFDKRLSRALGNIGPILIKPVKPSEWRDREVTLFIKINDQYRHSGPESCMDLRTTVMHEVIHAIKVPETMRSSRSMMLGHGPVFDEIKTHMEKVYGYENI